MGVSTNKLSPTFGQGSELLGKQDFWGKTEGRQETKLWFHKGLPADNRLEKAAMDLFITLERPPSSMVELAAHSGFSESPVTGLKYAEIHILTIRGLLEEGKRPDMPPGIVPS